MRRLLLVATALLLHVAPAHAQGAPGRRDLEQRVLGRLASIVQRRLDLDDSTMRRLMAVNRTFEDRRRELLREERASRVELRRQLAPGATPDQRRVDDLLDRLLGVQRRRLDLVAEEQRELSAFLTPVQRARYLALQDELRRRVEEMREGQGRRARESSPRRPPGGRPPR